MVNVTFRLAEADRDRIEWYAHAHRISFSKYLQNLVADHIERNLDEQAAAMRRVSERLWGPDGPPKMPAFKDPEKSKKDGKK